MAPMRSPRSRPAGRAAPEPWRGRPPAGGAPLTPSSSGRTSSLSMSFEALASSRGGRARRLSPSVSISDAAGGDHDQRAELGSCTTPSAISTPGSTISCTVTVGPSREDISCKPLPGRLRPRYRASPAEALLWEAGGRLQGDRVAEAPGGGQDPFEVGRRGGTRHRNPVVCEHLQRAGLSEILLRSGRASAARSPVEPGREVPGRTARGRRAARRGAERRAVPRLRPPAPGYRRSAGAPRLSWIALVTPQTTANGLCRGPDPLRGPGVALLGPVAVQVHT